MNYNIWNIDENFPETQEITKDEFLEFALSNNLIRQRATGVYAFNQPSYYYGLIAIGVFANNGGGISTYTCNSGGSGTVLTNTFKASS